MKRQKNMAQMKEQNKTLEKELNKMETSNLSEAEFKTLVIKVLKDLHENFNSIKKDMETLKKNQSVRLWCRHTWLTSSHNHIKITTKI